MEKRHIPLTLLLLSFIGTTALGDLKDGLVAYWAFDDGSGTVAADSSGNGHDGTLNLAPQWVEGLYGRALDFTYANTNECVVVPAFEVTGGGITLAAWVKPKSFAQARFPAEARSACGSASRRMRMPRPPRRSQPPEPWWRANGTTRPPYGMARR
jgi:hypothetical protein